MNQVSFSGNTQEFDDEFLEWEERDESVSYLTHCIAGSLAGVTEHVSMFPFDTIKTNMQAYGGRYTALQTAQRLYKAEGLAKFWRGASILASGCVPAHAIYFSVYEASKAKLVPKFHDKNNQVHPYAYALTGALATAVHDLVLTPFDMLKQRTQIASRATTGLTSLLSYVIQKEGFRSLYRSYPITLLMNVPQAATIVCVNETLKVQYRPKNGHNVLSYFFCAGIAGSLAATMTIPLDNIKTRLQTQTFLVDSRRDQEKIKTFSEKKYSVGQSLLKMATKSFAVQKSYFGTSKKSSIVPAEVSIKYTDIMSTVKTILREEGLRGFVKGVGPRIMTQAPASAISWTAYEMLKKLINPSKVF
jgi:solute carrier family 25 iron transporter 28/37